LTQLKSLFFGVDSMVTDESLTRLTNLTELALPMTTLVSNSALIQLTGLVSLNLDENMSIRGTTLRKLTNLQTLGLSWNNRIDSSVLTCLTQLTKLDAAYNHRLRGEHLLALSRLRSLNISGSNMFVSDDQLVQLTSLCTLNLYENDAITNKGFVRGGTNLTQLTMGCNLRITDLVFRSLGNLTSLSLITGENWYNIDGSGFSYLTALTELTLVDWRNRFSDQLTCLTTLEMLTLHGCQLSHLERLSVLPRLRCLRIGYDNTYSIHSLARAITQLEHLHCQYQSYESKSNRQTLPKQLCTNRFCSFAVF
jgi:hypothetical protein